MHNNITNTSFSTSGRKINLSIFLKQFFHARTYVPCLRVHCCAWSLCKKGMKFVWQFVEMGCSFHGSLPYVARMHGCYEDTTAQRVPSPVPYNVGPLSCRRQSHHLGFNPEKSACQNCIFWPNSCIDLDLGAKGRGG